MYVASLLPRPAPPCPAPPRPAPPWTRADDDATLLRPALFPPPPTPPLPSIALSPIQLGLRACRLTRVSHPRPRPRLLADLFAAVLPPLPRLPPPSTTALCILQPHTHGSMYVFSPPKHSPLTPHSLSFLPSRLELGAPDPRLPSQCRPHRPLVRLPLDQRNRARKGWSGSKGVAVLRRASCRRVVMRHMVAFQCMYCYCSPQVVMCFVLRRGGGRDNWRMGAEQTSTGAAARCRRGSSWPCWIDPPSTTPLINLVSAAPFY